MEKEKIKIEHVNINLLKVSEYNPRILTDKQERDLTKSIQKFKLIDPIIANQHKGREYFVISGHQRLKIACKLGYKTIPVVFVDLTPEKEKMLNLTMNRVSGEWNWEMLRDFNIETLLDTGFDDNDLSSIWDENLEIESDDFDTEKELEKAKTTTIKIGDRFQLGNHFLICGNSHDSEIINKLLGKTKVDCIINDPIYNTGVNYNKGIGGKANYGGDIRDNKSDENYKEFLKQGMENSLAHSKDDCHIFTWTDQRNIWISQILYQELGIKNERVCSWVKNGFNPTPNVAFNKATESCVYGTKGRPFLSKLSTKVSEILNKEIGTGNRTIDDIIDIFDIWLAKRDAGIEYSHSTQKPITLYEKPLLRCTKPRDIVLDIYAGSGTSVLACEQLKRVCYASEINPIFVQLIINRFESYADTKAKKLN